MYWVKCIIKESNIRAILSHKVYNVVCGERISINKLWESIMNLTNTSATVIHGFMRIVEVKDSLANIEKAKKKKDTSLF